MLADIHSHFLYGLDDGARSMDETMKMLLTARRQGIFHIAATPHAVPGRERFPLEQYHERLYRVQEQCDKAGLNIELYDGAEIFYTDDTLRLLDERRIPTLAGTRHVLLEFAPDEDYDHITRAARLLGGAGYMPVLAHVERYSCLRRLRLLEELHDELQVLIQLNAATVLEPRGLFTPRWLDKALRRGLIDLVASDAHSNGVRKFLMGPCHERLTGAYGTQLARELCDVGPGRILGIRTAANGREY